MKNHRWTAANGTAGINHSNSVNALDNFPCKASVRTISMVSALLVGSTLSAQEPPAIQQTISVGAYFSEGDYGEDVDTTVLYFPLTYETQIGKWGFQVQASHLEIEGLGNVLVNVGGATRAVANDRVLSSGLGDTTAAVTYQLDPVFQNGPFIDLRADIKIPTADENKSLGTGETDYGFQVDFYQPYKNVNLFASLGYRWRGDSAIFTGLKDSSFGQLGFVAPVTNSVSAGLIYDYRESASTFAEDSHELLPYLSWNISPRWTFSSFASWGFTDASPEIAVIAQIGYRW